MHFTARQIVLFNTLGVLNVSTISASLLPCSGWVWYSQLAVSGGGTSIDWMRPPVLRLNIPPRSYTKLNSTYIPRHEEPNEVPLKRGDFEIYTAVSCHGRTLSREIHTYSVSMYPRHEITSYTRYVSLFAVRITRAKQCPLRHGRGGRRRGMPTECRVRECLGKHDVCGGGNHMSNVHTNNNT